MAGAGFKTFNTGDVLTAADVNTYLMQQTVMVFASSAARSTALGVNVAEGMLSYLKDTDVVEVYNGSAWVSSDDPNAIQNSIVDAKGDIISATADNTPARLASSGVNGNVLTIDTSTSTGLKWAAPSGGDYVKISRTTYSAVANQSFDGVFTTTYKSYLIIIENHFGSGNTNLYFRFKDGNTLQQTSYNGQSFSYNNSSTLANNASSNAAALLIVAAVGSSGNDSTTAHLFINNVGTANANGVYSQVRGQATSSGNGKVSVFGGAHKLENADNDGFYLDPDSGTISGTVTVYGMAI